MDSVTRGTQESHETQANLAEAGREIAVVWTNCIYNHTPSALYSIAPNDPGASVMIN
jgi:hypothetical protein